MYGISQYFAPRAIFENDTTFLIFVGIHSFVVSWIGNWINDVIVKREWKNSKNWQQMIVRREFSWCGEVFVDCIGIHCLLYDTWYGIECHTEPYLQ